MDEKMFGFLSLIFLGCGVYSFYAYFKMKKGGPINDTLLLGGAYEEYKCKDKEAFLKKALPAVLTLAIVSTVYGIIDFVHFYVQPLGVLDTIGMVAFFVTLLGFFVYTGKLKKMYF